MEYLTLLRRQLNSEVAVNFNLIDEFGILRVSIELKMHLFLAVVIAFVFYQIYVFHFELIQGESI